MHVALLGVFAVSSLLRDQGWGYPHVHLGHLQAFHTKGAEPIPQPWLPKAPIQNRNDFVCRARHFRTPKSSTEGGVATAAVPKASKSRRALRAPGLGGQTGDFHRFFGPSPFGGGFRRCCLRSSRCCGAEIPGCVPVALAGFESWTFDVGARTLPPLWRRSKPSSGNGPGAQTSRCDGVAVVRCSMMPRL